VIAGLAALIAASVFLAALPGLHAYDVPGAPFVMAAAAVVSTATALLSGLVIRARPAISYAISLVSLSVFLLLIDGPHPGVIADAVARGPNRVLTETLPLSGRTVILSALVVLVWTAGAATSESMIRTSGPRVPLGVVIPLGVYVLTFAAASSAPSRDRVGAPLLLVVVSLAAVLRVRSDSSVVADENPDLRPPGKWRAPVVGAITVAVIASVLAMLLPEVPTFTRSPAGVHRQPPTINPTITDPVGAMAQLRDQANAADPANELSVQTSAPSTGYIGLADLDSYDGGSWRFTATFQPSGGRVPNGGTAAHPAIGGTVTQRIDVLRALPVPLMPALDRPLRVTGVDADADALTGMLLPRSSGHHDYAVVSSAPAVTLGGIPPADGLDQSAGVPADLAIPSDTSGDLATTLRFLAPLTGQSRPTASVAFLQSVLRALQTAERRVSGAGSQATPTSNGPPRGVTTTTVEEPATEGTALSEVINSVTVNRAATPEQFATFFAMIARDVGVPARLVTGFRIAESSAGQPVGPGHYVLSDRQAWAWVEVPVVGVGWVVCDPTPDATTTAAVPPTEAASPSATTVPPRQANAVPAAGTESGHALARPVARSTAGAHHLPGWADALLLGAAVLLLMLLAGPGQAAVRRDRRRRRRRDSSEPRELAVGAWLELLDGLERAGLVPTAGATASEIAAEVGHHFGREHIPAARKLAGVADAAVFSSHDWLTYESAIGVWTDAHGLTRQILAGLDRRQRLRAAVLVGSSPATPGETPR
jgi:hypothetical protein